MRPRSWFALVALLLPAAAHAQAPSPPPPPPPLPLQHTPQHTVPAITARDLMTRLYIFADDSMQGREAGTIGNVKGTDYIAAEIGRLGLVPAGDAGTYFQTIPLKTRTFDTTSTFSVGGASLKAFTDYVALGPQAVAAPSLAIVYGGELGDSTHWITREQADGKLVVLGVKGRLASVRSLRAPPALSGAAAILFIALDSLPPQLVAFVARPRGFLDDSPGGSPAMPPLFLIGRAAAARMFSTPLEQLAAGAGGASGAHDDHIGFTHAPVDHDSIRIWNHVVRPEGADDARKQATAEQQAQVNAAVAAFRAQHAGADRLDSISNGADDDGSGSVAALEIAERLASLKPKPKRSILFVWHTGEEKGLLGSRYFTDHPTVPRDSIVGQLNMDMVGRGAADDETGRTRDSVPLHGGPRYVQLVGSRRLSTELGDLIERVNTEGRHNLTFDYALDANGHPSNIYCRSDHYEYTRYGIPITFFTTGLHSDYHQVTDEPQYIDYEHLARVAALVADAAVRVADLDHRVVVDHPKPDPSVPCRQ